jgi:hypothetical protein
MTGRRADRRRGGAALAAALAILVGGVHVSAAPKHDGEPELQAAVAAALSGETAARRQAIQRLRAAGVAGLRALRQAARRHDGPAHERATKLWSKLLEERCQERLTGRPGWDDLDWSLAVRSKLFPYIRSYVANGDRYPQAAIIDVEHDAEIGRLDEEHMRIVLRRSGTRRACRSRKGAREIVRFFLSNHYLPYPARNLKLKVRRARRALLVTGHFERTIPWSSDARPTEVGTRKARREIAVRVSRRCGFQVVRNRVLRTVYSDPAARPRHEKASRGD